MATRKTTLDRPQRAYVTLTEGAANGGNVVQFPSSFSTADQKGIEILSYSLELGSTLNFKDVFPGDEDGFCFGIGHLYYAGVVPGTRCTPGVIDLQWNEFRLETAVGFALIKRCMKIDFDVPQIAHPASLYAYLRGVSLAVALSGYISIDYRLVDLPDEDYKDILQSILIQNQI